MMNIFKKIFDRYRKSFEKSARVRIAREEGNSDNVDLLNRLLALDEKEKDIYIIVTGLRYYFGAEPFSEGTRIFLIKEPSNKYDPKAIMAVCDGYGKCGYVAANENTVKPNTLSAEMIYGGFRDQLKAEVLWADESFAICKIGDMTVKDLLYRWAVRLYDDGDAALALKIFLKLDRTFSEVEIIFGIFSCCLKLDDFEKAEKYEKVAMEMDSENPYAQKMRETLATEINKKQIK